MHILILGATGQIGYELSRVLSKEHTITIMIRGNRKNLAFPDAATLIKSASYDEEAMREALEHSDLVVYALGTPAQWLPDRNDFHVNNFLLLKRFLDVLIGTGVRTMVYISTYELFKSIDGYIRESHPLTDAPLHPYYESMLKSYVLMKEYEKRYDLQVISVGGRVRRASPRAVISSPSASSLTLVKTGVYGSLAQASRTRLNPTPTPTLPTLSCGTSRCP